MGRERTRKDGPSRHALVAMVLLVPAVLLVLAIASSLSIVLLTTTLLLLAAGVLTTAFLAIVGAPTRPPDAARRGVADRRPPGELRPLVAEEDADVSFRGVDELVRDAKVRAATTASNAHDHEGGVVLDDGHAPWDLAPLSGTAGDPRARFEAGEEVDFVFFGVAKDHLRAGSVTYPWTAIVDLRDDGDDFVLQVEGLPSKRVPRAAVSDEKTFRRLVKDALDACGDRPRYRVAPPEHVPKPCARCAAMVDDDLLVAVAGHGALCPYCLAEVGPQRKALVGYRG